MFSYTIPGEIFTDETRTISFILNEDPEIARAQREVWNAHAEFLWERRARTEAVLGALPDVFTFGLYSTVRELAGEIGEVWDARREGPGAVTAAFGRFLWNRTPIGRGQRTYEAGRELPRLVRELETNLASSDPRVRGSTTGQLQAIPINLVNNLAFGGAIAGPGTSLSPRAPDPPGPGGPGPTPSNPGRRLVVGGGRAPNGRLPGAQRAGDLTLDAMASKDPDFLGDINADIAHIQTRRPGLGQLAQEAPFDEVLLERIPLVDDLQGSRFGVGQSGVDNAASLLRPGGQLEALLPTLSQGYAADMIRRSGLVVTFEGIENLSVGQLLRIVAHNPGRP
ncbi:MAG: hypothetical protein AB7S26_04220 [Sandaracinaceae bacterium]